jgi:hypothetical protein
MGEINLIQFFIAIQFRYSLSAFLIISIGGGFSLHLKCHS